MESIYHIETDIECKVLLYGKEICLAVPGKDISIMLRKGRHKFSFVSTENPSDQYSIVFEVPENDIEDYIEIELKSYRANRIKREEEEQRIAFETEQKRRREEEEIEARKKKLEAEIAKRIKEKKEREKAQAEIEEQKKLEKKRLWESREKRYQAYLRASYDYSHYVISSTPNKSNKFVYLVPCEAPWQKYKYRGTVFEPFTKIKTIGDHSQVFPAIKCAKRVAHVTEKELIRHFADVSYDTIKRICLYNEGRVSALPFRSFEEWRIREDSKRIELRDKLLSLSKTIYYDALFNFVQDYYDSRFNQGIGPILTADDLPRIQKSHSFYDNILLKFFLYKVANSNKWRLLFYKLFEKSFTWSEGVYKSHFFELIEDTTNDAGFDWECKNYRLVYIDEACNEIVDATGNLMVSSVSNGVMIWANPTNNEHTFVYSFLDFRGNELFKMEYSKPSSFGGGSSIFIPRYQQTGGLFFGVKGINKDGRFIVSGFGNSLHEFWISGIINELPSMKDRLTLKADIHFKHPDDQSIHMPQNPLCCLINGKYYLSTYQGMLEIQKPKEWDDIKQINRLV